MTWRAGSEFPIGCRFGNYRISGVLGQGGHAIVYEAVNEQLGKKVAVKILRPEYSRHPEIEKRFLNEARSVNRIPHPGLVNIFEYGKTPNNCTYIVMEHLNGDSLQRYIETNSPLTPAKSLHIVQCIASVLTAAHAAGVVHRDLKPANIIMVPDPDVPGGERPKIFDFGIAKVDLALGVSDGRPRSNLTVAGLPLGTPGYMAPEQERQAGSATDRADVYSLGVIFTELLGPYRQLLSEPGQPAADPSSSSPAPSSLPSAVEVLRQSMLHLDPSQRPTMKAVRDQLKQLISSLDLTTPRRSSAVGKPLLAGAASSPIPTLPASLAIMLPPDSEPPLPSEQRLRLPLQVAAGSLAVGVLLAAALRLLALIQPGPGPTLPIAPTLKLAAPPTPPSQPQPKALPPAPPLPPSREPPPAPLPPAEPPTATPRPVPEPGPSREASKESSDGSRKSQSKGKRHSETPVSEPPKEWTEDDVNKLPSHS